MHGFSSKKQCCELTRQRIVGAIAISMAWQFYFSSPVVRRWRRLENKTSTIFAKGMLTLRFSVTSSNCASSLNPRVLRFKIGYTTALDRRIAELVGTKPPPDLAARIQRQNEEAAKLLETDVATSK